MQVWEPLADAIIFRPSPNMGYVGKVFRPRCVTWHITQGSLSSALAWLTNPVSQASAHVVIGRAGEVFSLVPLREASWAGGRVCNPDRSNPIVAQTVGAGLNPNLVSYSIECVGLSSRGVGGSLTQLQAAALQRVTAYMCWRSTLTADRTHILGHYQWDSCDRPNCPGFSAAEWASWVARVDALCKLWRGW